MSIVMSRCGFTARVPGADYNYVIIKSHDFVLFIFREDSEDRGSFRTKEALSRIESAGLSDVAFGNGPAWYMGKFN